MSAVAKKTLTDKQEKFLDSLFENGGNVQEAMAVASYHPNSRSNLINSVKNEIIERTKSALAGSAPKSAQRIQEGLDADGTLPSSQMEVRMKAAADILDRIGITKRQEIDVRAEVVHGVVLLPSKKPMVNVTP